MGIAVRMEDGDAVIAPFEVLGDLSGLELRSKQGELVTYTGVELATDRPWVRLPIRTEAVSFVKENKEAEVELSFNAKGEPMFEAEALQVPVAGWMSVKPGDLRAQLALISRVRDELAESPPSKETRDLAAKTTWATTWLLEQTLSEPEPMNEDEANQ